MKSFEEFCSSLDRVRERIEVACAKAGRSSAEVLLLPVTKNHSVEAVSFAAEAGFLRVGENRVQEALEKMPLASVEMNWDLIGPLQSNKANRAASSFARIQTIDRLKIAQALDRHAASCGRRLETLIQVNAGGDPAKSGVSVDGAEALLERVLELPNLDVTGLMTIAPLSEDPAVARKCFFALRACRDRLQEVCGVALHELSMGMSGDLEEAICEGSTLVRVGSALFGERD